MAFPVAGLDALLNKLYMMTPVATWANAQAIAVGVQCRIVVVSIDEHDAGKRNVYFYHGDGQPLTDNLF